MTVDLIEPMGAETLVHLRNEHQELRVVTDWKQTFAEGDLVHVRFNRGSIHIFDVHEQRVTTL
jgi:ABC-type sugar transport system ATPase subunit